MLLANDTDGIICDPFWDILILAWREIQKTKKPVYTASSSVDISAKYLQNTKHKCWPLYQSVLQATASLCSAYKLCSVKMCTSAWSKHTVKQWLVHITILILGH